LIPTISEGLRTLLVATAALAAGFTWQALRTAAVPTASPDRLVGELRLAQIAALLLSLSAGAYIGIAAVHEARLGIGLDVAFAVGFLIVAGVAIMREPRHALTMLSLAFAAHAVLDVAHRPGLLPAGVAPWWYSVGCAVFDLYVSALCYLPVWRRP
jgi:hypothetical protein